VRRREFITLLGGTVTTWPLAAGAQQRSGPVRRVGVLDTLASDDPYGQERVGVFLQGLQQAGWSIGENVRVDTRWGSGRPDNLRKHAAELVTLAPDVIMTTGMGLDLLRQVTQTIPIVFVLVPDPVGAGFIESLARPGGNVTGFTQAEYSMGIKSLELLKQLAPYITRVGVIRDATTPSGIGQFGAIQGTASSFAVEVIPLGERDAVEIERSISAFARGRNDGLIVASGASATLHRDLIVTLAARHKLPAVYPARFFAAAGGLISYGSERLDPYRRAAGYVDRILKGEKPADLPVQAPTKYELVINLKAAKALGLEIPPTLLALADEVIE
jgi:putative tryptophan/tyrosine transport system substrate-binding protein